MGSVVGSLVNGTLGGPEEYPGSVVVFPPHAARDASVKSKRIVAVNRFKNIIAS
jgi:hypothetical protein